MGFVNQLVTGYWTKIQSNGLALASRVPLAFFLCPWCNSHSNAKVQQTMPLWECEFEGMCMSVQTIICLRGRIALSDKMIRLFSRSRIEKNKTPSYDWRMIGRFIWLFCIMTNLSASFLTSKWFSHMMSYDSCSTKKLEKFGKSVSDMFTKCHVAVCQNHVIVVNIKIAGKWMFIPLKMVLIGIDPYPNQCPICSPNAMYIPCWGPHWRSHLVARSESHFVALHLMCRRSLCPGGAGYPMVTYRHFHHKHP